MTRAARTSVRPTKYRAVRTTIDGITFASKKEALVYAGLKLAEKMGDISELKLQPRIKLIAGGVHICTYVCDFFYFDRRRGNHLWVDAKGFKTPIYKLKKKLVLALTGIEIIEV